MPYVFKLKTKENNWIKLEDKEGHCFSIVEEPFYATGFTAKWHAELVKKTIQTDNSGFTVQIINQGKL